MDKGKYFAVEISEDTYLISGDAFVSQERWEDSMEFGPPTGNSYLIKGKEEALLIDSSIPLPGFRSFAEELAGMPVKLIIAHGHYDHIYQLKEFDEFWIHKKDYELVKGHAPNPLFQALIPPYLEAPESVHFLQEGDCLDIGNGHKIVVYHMPGHTDGSLLLFDQKTKILFTSDTIARRLLYGICSFVPLSKFIEDLKRINKLEFNIIYSCHDRKELPKSYIDFMIEHLEKIQVNSGQEEIVPGGKKHSLENFEFLNYSYGEETTLHYFGFAVPWTCYERGMK